MADEKVAFVTLRFENGKFIHWDDPKLKSAPWAYDLDLAPLRQYLNDKPNADQMRIIDGIYDGQITRVIVLLQNGGPVYYEADTANGPQIIEHIGPQPTVVDTLLIKNDSKARTGTATTPTDENSIHAKLESIPFPFGEFRTEAEVQNIVRSTPFLVNWDQINTYAKSLTCPIPTWMRITPGINPSNESALIIEFIDSKMGIMYYKDNGSEQILEHIGPE